MPESQKDSPDRDSDPTHKHDHGEEQSHSHSGADGHAHGAELRQAPARRLVFALALTVLFMGVEITAGFLTGSLALLSDAAHMLTDAGALTLALLAQRVALRPATPQRTYGFRRAETLAALVNGAALGASSLWIIVEAVRRWSHPPEVRGLGMLVVAAVGLLVNLASAWVLSRGRQGHNANTRAALAHVAADAAGSVAAIVAGVLLLVLGWRRVDPAVSVLLSVLLLWGAWKLLQEAVGVLMEGVPPGVDTAAVGRTILGAPGVTAMHDLHVWTVADGFPAVTVHVVLDGERHGTEVAREVAQRIKTEHQIEHVTVQPEAPSEATLIPPSSLKREAGQQPP